MIGRVDKHTIVVGRSIDGRWQRDEIAYACWLNESKEQMRIARRVFWTACRVERGVACSDASQGGCRERRRVVRRGTWSRRQWRTKEEEKRQCLALFVWRVEQRHSQAASPHHPCSLHTAHRDTPTYNSLTDCTSHLWPIPPRTFHHTPTTELASE